MEFIKSLMSLAAGFFLFLVFILITRELWCWYLKQNKIVDLLTEIRDELRRR